MIEIEPIRRDQDL